MQLISLMGSYGSPIRKLAMDWMMTDWCDGNILAARALEVAVGFPTACI
jgi:hypothetical protein